MKDYYTIAVEIVGGCLVKGTWVIKSWVIVGLIILNILGGALFSDWINEKKLTKMGTIIESIPEIDAIRVKDGKTSDEVLTLTNSEPFFDEMVDIYGVYTELKWSERKLLKKDPFVQVDYLKNDDVRFTVSIYNVKDDEKSLLPDEEDGDSFSYSLEGNDTYIFAFDELNHLVRVNEGLKELLHIIHEK